MNGNQSSGICLFKAIVSKYQVDSRSTITLLLRKLTTGMPDLMDQFGNNINYFNKDILSVGTTLRARGQDPGNLLLQLFATYADCSSDHGPFTQYIEMLEISTKMEHRTFNLRILCIGKKLSTTSLIIRLSSRDIPNWINTPPKNVKL